MGSIPLGFIGAVWGHMLMELDLSMLSMAGVARFRAILLPSASTFAGVAPLVLAPSLQAQFLKPLAVSLPLGFGVMFATILILMILPSSCLVLEDLKRAWRRWWGGAERVGGGAYGGEG